MNGMMVWQGVDVLLAVSNHGPLTLNPQRLNPGAPDKGPTAVRPSILNLFLLVDDGMV